MEFPELLLTTCRSLQQWSAVLWDPSTANMLHCYKNGGVIAPKTLNLIDYDYIFSADEDKPMTHLWLINNQEQDKKMSTILPDKVNAMAVCPHFIYLAVGIGIKLYVWHLPSGKLLSIQKKHFQPITCVKFDSDGQCVIVTGQDGMLTVYKLGALVSLHSNLQMQSEGQVEPLYTKHDHSLPITDVYVGSFGYKSRIVTVSSDNTCKMYTLNTGTMLLNLIFEEPLTSVIFDGPCWNLFVGCESGKIQRFLLREPPKGAECHITSDLIFQGHKKRITCLDLFISNAVLVSGSEDNFVFIWEIASRQILKRIEHKGAITNVKCLIKHDNFFNQNLKVKHVVRNLDRDLVQDEDFIVGKFQDFDIEVSDQEENDEKTVIEGGSGQKDLVAENARLRSVNQQLFEAALKMSQKYNDFS